MLVAFIQEYRSEKSLESLNKLVPHYCHVVRNGHAMTVLASELVPGDIVRVSTGDRVPADLRLIQATDLDIDESNLSGETSPMRKHVDAIALSQGSDSVAVSDRFNTALMGTLLRGGHGIGVVVGIGKETEFGIIWMMMKDVEAQKTPLQLKMEGLGKQLSVISVHISSIFYNCV
jgi:P-type Ca2+ transporter type 2C